MKVEIIRCLLDNYSYLIIDEKTQTACVVDPSEAKPVINFLENKKINLKYILQLKIFQVLQKDFLKIN